MYIILIGWPASYGVEFVKKNWAVSSTWVLGCAAMSIFTLLPAIKVESSNLM